MRRSDKMHGVFGKPARVGASVLLAASLVAAASAPALAVNGGACNRPYAPGIQADDFRDGAGHPNPIDNLYFPLEPGTTFRYVGTKDAAALVDVMTVTGSTKPIMGVMARVVRDSAYENGILVEDTFDWYAQDDAGNVWYCGEDTRELDAQGNVTSTEGSWQAGDGPNLPGILMKAHPAAGVTYRQEYAPDVAVDMATGISIHRHISVPYGSLAKVLETKEFSCIEKTIDHKFYAPGVGLIRELAVANGREDTALVSKTP